jgi:hypothetical protein
MAFIQLDLIIQKARHTTQRFALIIKILMYCKFKDRTIDLESIQATINSIPKKIVIILKTELNLLTLIFIVKAIVIKLSIL